MTLTRTLMMLAFVATTSTACLTRTVIRLDDHPDRAVSLMETIDVVPYISRTHQFWLCKDAPTGLTCEKTCNGQTDLTCQAVSFGGSNLK